MATFYVAFVWGLGVSFGGAVGVLAFVILNRCVDWVSCRGDALAAALQERNVLSADTVSALLQIADAAEKIARATPNYGNKQPGE